MYGEFVRDVSSNAQRVAVGVIALAGVLLAFAWLSPGVATPERAIVVHGSDSGSHLRLQVVGGAISVQGSLKPGGQVGCEGSGNHLTCPVAGAGVIEVDMGPADDKVEVLDGLPIPLITHLGAGSDKLLGNSEPDTCYSEGTKRNRCYGFGGNDTCITGNLNSDCVGGDGNDYCEHGDGSDGCWGGPGNDICKMGPGQDGCHGESGNDRLYGEAAADQLYGGPGSDFCDGGPGVGRSHECESGPGH